MYFQNLRALWYVMCGYFRLMSFAVYQTVETAVRKPMPLYVYKVRRYPAGFFDLADKDYTDVTDAFFAGENVYHEGCFLEYRFTWKSKKYRYIDTKNRFLSFACLPRNGKFPVKVLQATLNGVDVTSTVRKFEGPNGDFFGNKIPWNWMFPHELFDELDVFRVLYTDLTMRTFEQNEFI